MSFKVLLGIRQTLEDNKLEEASKIFAFNLGFSNVRVLRKHRHIKECAGSIISYENDYIGGRISDRTNVCEGLPYSWTWNQTTEEGYGYYRKISTQKTFDPPIGVRDDGFGFTLPGTFNTGASLRLNVTMYEDRTSGISISLKDASNSRGFYLWFNAVGNQVYFNEVPDEPLSKVDSSPDAFFQSTNQVQITFEAQKNSIQLLVDGKRIATKGSKNVRLDSLTHVALQTRETNEETALFLHRFEFRYP